MWGCGRKRRKVSIEWTKWKQNLPSGSWRREFGAGAPMQRRSPRNSWMSSLPWGVFLFSHLIWSCLYFSFLEGDVWVQDLPVQVRPQRLRAMLPEPAPIKLPSMQVRTCNFHSIWTDRVWYLKQVMIFMIWLKHGMVAPSRFQFASTLYNCLQRLHVYHSDISIYVRVKKRRVL